MTSSEERGVNRLGVRQSNIKVLHLIHFLGDHASRAEVEKSDTGINQRVSFSSCGMRKAPADDLLFKGPPAKLVGAPIRRVVWKLASHKRRKQVKRQVNKQVKSLDCINVSNDVNHFKTNDVPSFDGRKSDVVAPATKRQIACYSSASVGWADVIDRFNRPSKLNWLEIQVLKRFTNWKFISGITGMKSVIQKWYRN